jgi:hypothetical protein
MRRKRYPGSPRFGHGGHWGGDPGKKKGKKRKASPYNKFVSFHMKKGLTMKQVARLWKHKKAGHTVGSFVATKARKGHKASKTHRRAALNLKGLTKKQRRQIRIKGAALQRSILHSQREVARAWRKENQAKAVGDRQKLHEAKREKSAAQKKVKQAEAALDSVAAHYHSGSRGYAAGMAHRHVKLASEGSTYEERMGSSGDPDRKLPKHAYAKWLHKNAGKFKTKRERKAAWKKHKHALLRTSKARKGSRKAHKKAHKGKKKGSRKVKRHRSIRGYTTRGLSRAEQRHMHRQYRLATRRKGGKGRKGGRKGRRSPR